MSHHQPESAHDLDYLLPGILRRDRRDTDRFCRELEEPIRNSIGRFFPDENEDADDVVQETLIAVVNYLQQRGEFSGNIVRFAVTIANNRCRDLIRWKKRRPVVEIDSLGEWIKDGSRSALDHLENEQILEIMHRAVDELGDECRKLLRAMYLQDVPAEDLRRRIGLKSVQGVYHRRAVCLRQAFLLLKRRLSDRSLTGPD